MPARDEIRDLVAILDEEGFGALAGEILFELSQGREVEKPRQLLEGEDEDGETILRRVPITEEEQISEAISIIRRRLIDPVRAYLEAENLAGQLMETDRVRIVFFDPEQEDAPVSFVSSDSKDSSEVEKLDSFLKRLPNLLVDAASE